MSIIEKIEECINNFNCSILNLDGKINDQNIKYLIEYFPKLQNLEILILSNNSLSDIKLLSENLFYLESLEELSLECGVELNVENAILLGQALRKLPNLRSLDLGDLILQDALEYIVDSFGCLSGLTELNLDSNYFGDAQLTHLFNHLEHLHNLITLDLGSNKIGNTGIKCLAENLKHVPKLRCLYLWYNEINDEGAKWLAENLKYVPNLFDLELSYNKIGDDGAKCLFNSLHLLKNLGSFSAYKNPMSNYWVYMLKMDTIERKREGYIRSQVGKLTKPCKRV